MGEFFGTDGIRGVAGQFPLDPSTVERIGYSLARQLASRLKRPPVLVIGRDTRESGEWLTDAVVRGIKAAGSDAHSAGVSVTSSQDCGSFRWKAFAGRAAVSFGEKPAHEFDWHSPLLLKSPQLAGTFLADLSEPIAEALVVPIEAGGEPAGNIWVMLHDASRHFEPEDLRLLTNLSRFASAWHGVTNVQFLQESDDRFTNKVHTVTSTQSYGLAP